MLIIRKAQLAAFERAAVDRFRDRLVVIMERNWRSMSGELGAATFQERVATCVTRARDWNLASEIGIARYTNVCFALSGGQPAENATPWVADILAREDLDELDRTALLLKHTSRHLGAEIGE